MGGDDAPGVVIKGAKIACKRFPQVEYLMFGDERRIAPLLAKAPKLAACTKVHHTEEVIPGDMKPSIALRQGRQSSMRLAIDAVRDGLSAGVVSAGNTGALMAMARMSLKMLAGIDRPAIASFFPTLRGESVMLDLGANVECDANNLLQFAIMGDVFARTVLGARQPSVGLLNVGSEDMKGHEELRTAAAMLRARGATVVQWQPPAPHIAGGLLFGIFGVTVLVWLGVWQVHRLAWKTALLAESNVPGTAINVDTTEGKVTLRGKLDSQAQIDRAVQVARGVDGVRDVDNQLTTS